MSQPFLKTKALWHLCRGLFLSTAAIACFSLSTVMVAKPPPDGDQGNGNTAEGKGALNNNVTGANNTADGFDALFNNTSGGNNTATGYQALLNNTTASGNAATGFQSLVTNTTGAGNTGNGSQTLFYNTVGNENTANGNFALFHNTTGNDNTANGDNALNANTTGNSNTANGNNALSSNTTSGFNTADGAFALFVNTGGNNIAVGYNSGGNLTTGSGNIDIGNVGMADESGTIRIGTVGNQTATFVAGIAGTPVTGVAVVVNADGQLGTLVSSQRFKDQIKSMDKTSEAILALKPVTFRYKHEIDPIGIPQFGLVAEEVEKVNPDLVARDASGKVYTVRYEAVNAMLLNEFLKEHRKVEELETALARQQKGMELLASRVREQGAQLQKVSAQVEANQPASRVVDN